MASDLSQAESTGLEVARSALDQAMQGEDVEAITTALSNLRHAVAAAESAVSARRSSTEPDQVAAPGEESPTGAPSGRGDGESAEADRPGEGEPESPAQVGARPTPSHRVPRTSLNRPRDRLLEGAVPGTVMRRAHPVAEAVGVSEPGTTFVGQRD